MAGKQQYYSSDGCAVSTCPKTNYIADNKCLPCPKDMHCDGTATPPKKSSGFTVINGGDGGCRLKDKNDGGAQDTDWTSPSSNENCQHCLSQCLASASCIAYECHPKELGHCELWTTVPRMSSGKKDGYQCWKKSNISLSLSLSLPASLPPSLSLCLCLSVSVSLSLALALSLSVGVNCKIG